MDFLKISIWLFTTVLSVNSFSRSHPKCPYYPIHYVDWVQDQRNCFCFYNQRDYRKVPEVIHHGGQFTERLVYYVYKDLLSGQITLYIPNKEKQLHIPDLAYEEDDILVDNPTDFIHTFNKLKVIIEINRNQYVTNKPIAIDDAVATVTTHTPTRTTKAPTTITGGLTVTNFHWPTLTTEEPTVATKKSSFPTEELFYPTEKHTVTTEEPTNKQTINIEEKTVTSIIRTTTTDEPTRTTEEATLFTVEYPVTNKKPKLTTEKPSDITKKQTGTTVPAFISEEPPAITDEPKVSTEVHTVITGKPTGTTVSTLITEKPTTAHNRKIKTVTTKEPITEEPSTSKTPEPTIAIAEPTTSEVPSPVTISPLPNHDNHPGKVLRLQDLYYIIQFIQSRKDSQEPIGYIWEQILKKLNLDKLNKHNEFNKEEGKIVINDDLEHNSYTFDLWFEQQLDGFSESDNFISLTEIKQYVRNILLENGMIVTMEGLLTDLQGKVLDLRELKLRPILIGKPLNIGKIFDQKQHMSDFLIPSDSPYMEALVVTLSNPSMILGIIPLGKTIIKKNVQKSVSVPPHGKHGGMVKEWVQNGKKYSRHGNKWKENVWFNIKGHPKLSHSHPSQKKIIKHKYFEEPNNPTDGFKLESSRLDGIIQIGEGEPIRLNVDPNELQTWENLLKDTTRSEKDSLSAWKKTIDTHTDGELISGLNIDDSKEFDILNNQLLMDSQLIPGNELHTSWQHLGHLEPGNVKLDRIELDAFNHKLVNRPVSSETNEILSFGENSEKPQESSGQVITFKADNPSELDALKDQLLKNPTLYGKAGLKLLAALQRNEIVKAGRTSETIRYDVDNITELDQLSKFLKDPKTFAKMVKKLFRTLQRKGFVQAENGEAVKLKVHNPRELEALRNQLLNHPKIFSRAAKELLTVMEHNGIGLSDIAPLVNETAATSLEDSVPLAEEDLNTQEYLSPQLVPLPSEDADGYYDVVEDDITGRIVGGSAATGSGAPLSMKGRMKDF